MNALTIESATLEDAEAIAIIYAYWVAETTVSFETTPPKVEEIRARISDKQKHGMPWLVGKVDGKVVGYAYAGERGEREAFHWTVESSIYLAYGHQGHGIGTQLYRALITILHELGYRRVLAEIALPNDASTKLHERIGFVPVGRELGCGRKFGRWIDLERWYLDLNSDGALPEVPTKAVRFDTMLMASPIQRALGKGGHNGEAS